ncbi:MAG: DUF3516 domain-containing protein [Sandaracinaceae bacterium]|nr:DUF3516 domain-containing protein [Sandaracinaceae bacterium]
MEAPLARRLPDGPFDPDALLEGFLDYATEQGLSLYPAQEEAILELFSGRSVILATPTGSGKSLVAAALMFLALSRRERIFYTAPIKALVSEKFFAACRDFGAANVGMMTGDASVNRDAPIICCTAEILANVALREMEDANVGYVVMDEFHYYADRDRGWAWQVPLLTLPEPTRFLLMSATLGDTRRFEEALEARTGEAPALVAGAERPVPLDYEYRLTPIHETVNELVRDGKAPIYLVHFTQRAAAEQAQALTSLGLAERSEKDAIQSELRAVRFDTPFGKDLRRWLGHAIGVHHAGLLPKYRLLVEKLAQRGLLRVICGTDTLGVGVNVPIRTVVFTQLCKYDGAKTAILSVRDFQQIAGRAGRKGFDVRGSVVCQAPEHVIENERARGKAGGDPKKLRKLHAKKPPERGYAHWDEGTFERLYTGQPERLESRFEVTPSMLLNVLDRRDGDGCRRMKQLIRATHEPPRLKYAHGRRAIAMFRSLLASGVVEIDRREDRAYVDVKAELQSDFALNQSLSLFVVEAVEALDREEESYAWDVITFVEATLEDPEIVLRHQLDKKKTDLVNELKAEGVEYEERMRRLEQVDIDRPNAELIRALHEEFGRRHPVLAHEKVRPKSVAREVLERGFGFVDYVKEYGLARSEGALLRYLSDAYKALERSVPESAKTDLLYDLTDELGAMVRDVDSSLLDEWERLEHPERFLRPEAAPEAPSGPADPSADVRAFTAAIRNQCYRLVRLLALGPLEDAEELTGWDAARLTEALAPYRAAHREIRIDAEARHPKNTLIERGERAWTVRQILVDPDDDLDFSLLCSFDLERARAEGRPVLELIAIGES